MPAAPERRPIISSAILQRKSANTPGMKRIRAAVRIRSVKRRPPRGAFMTSAAMSGNGAMIFTKSIITARAPPKIRAARLLAKLRCCAAAPGDSVTITAAPAIVTTRIPATPTSASATTSTASAACEPFLVGLQLNSSLPNRPFHSGHIRGVHLQGLPDHGASGRVKSGISRRTAEDACPTKLRFARPSGKAGGFVRH